MRFVLCLVTFFASLRVLFDRISDRSFNLGGRLKVKTMKTMKTHLLAIATLLMLTGSAVTSSNVNIEGCHMFPPNNLRYPVTNGAEATGISQQDFDQVLNALESVYAPIVAAEHATLKISRDWENPEVNAASSRSPFGSTWILHMYGGMARHPQMTKEAFLLVACHEMGHQLGKSTRYTGTPMASEGQADYFATLKCMRRVLHVFKTAGETVRLAHAAGRLATQACGRFQKLNLDGNNDAMAICLREHSAADTLAKILGALTNDKRAQKGLPQLPIPDLQTPDESVSPHTLTDTYPLPQCRLDTYSAGALCPVPVETPLDANSANSGVCLLPTRGGQSLAKSNQNSIDDQLGARPRCWYNQEEMN
jgi:hypothetical protein